VRAFHALAQGSPDVLRHVRQQFAALSEDDRRDVARVGSLFQPRVDLRLRLRRHRLIRRERINREEPLRMPRQPVDGDHPDPSIRGAQRVCTFPIEEVFAQRRDPAQRRRVIEDEQVLRHLPRRVEIDPRQRVRHIVQQWRLQARRTEHRAERVDVAAVRNPCHQRRFDERGPAAHEGVVHDIAGTREALDEEVRQLRFETGAIGNLVEAVRRALPGRPEFVRERWYDDRAAVRRRHRDLAFACSSAAPAEAPDGVLESAMARMGGEHGDTRLADHAALESNTPRLTTPLLARRLALFTSSLIVTTSP